MNLTRFCRLTNEFLFYEIARAAPRERSLEPHHPMEKQIMRLSYCEISRGLECINRLRPSSRKMCETFTHFS